MCVHIWASGSGLGSYDSDICHTFDFRFNFTVKNGQKSWNTALTIMLILHEHEMCDLKLPPAPWSSHLWPLRSRRNHFSVSLFFQGPVLHLYQVSRQNKLFHTNGFSVWGWGIKSVSLLISNYTFFFLKKKPSNMTNGKSVCNRPWHERNETDIYGTLNINRQMLSS